MQDTRFRGSWRIAEVGYYMVGLESQQRGPEKWLDLAVKVKPQLQWRCQHCYTFAKDICIIKWCWSKDRVMCTKGSREEGLMLLKPLGAQKITLLTLDMEVNYLMYAVFCILLLVIFWFALIPVFCSKNVCLCHCMLEVFNLDLISKEALS